MNIFLETLHKNSIKSPDKNALIFESDKITYADLWKRAELLASSLQKHGIAQGERVVVRAEHSVEFVVSCLATWFCKAIVVPVDERATEEQITAVCKNVNGRVVTCNSDSNCGEYDIPDSNQTACLMFTTGTTGSPKGVLWSFENIYQNCLIRGKYFNFDSSNVSLAYGPLNHAAPMWTLFSNLFYGGTGIFISGLMQFAKIYDCIGKYRVNCLHMPPASIGILEQLAPEILTDYADVIKTVAIGSSAITDRQKAFLRDSLPNSDLIYTYASTETGVDTCINLHNVSKNDFCTGLPCAGVQIAILDENLQPVKRGEYGTIAVKSAMTTVGYWNNDELNAQSFCNGYFVSNDIGFIDSDGCLNVVGRRDDVINIGGLKVLPSEIENLTFEIPGVEDCICFAVDDSITNKALCLQIKGSDIDLSLVRKYLSERLDSYKIPKYIEMTSVISRTFNGKPDRIKQASLRINNQY